MFEKIADLHKLCFPHKPWSAGDFNDLKKSGCEIIASDNGFIVWRTVLDESELITIGVHPDARGSGIASAMLKLMENEIISDIRYQISDIHKIFLEVAEDNILARKLYESHGYKQIGVRSKYYNSMDLSTGALAKVDAILMEKVL